MFTQRQFQLRFAPRVFKSRSLLWLALVFCAAAVFASALRERSFLASGFPAAQPVVTPVKTVSAASFETPVAPESIAAMFGLGLALRVEAAATVPLPTTLAGTSVKVRDSMGVERPAQLFFVAPDQVNCLIPAGTASGMATVTVTSGDGKVSTGAAQIAKVAAGLFSANANGAGAPAGVALRRRANPPDTFESLAIYDDAKKLFVPKPLSFVSTGEQVFLSFFGTGVRGRDKLDDVSVQIGGVRAPVLFAGPVEGLAGLDQINVGPVNIGPELRSLIGRGRVNVTVSVAGFGSCNVVEMEVAAPPGPVRVNDFVPPTALAGQMMTITGEGFYPTPPENTVLIGGVEARVMTASANQLTIIVPFGGRSGPVSVITPGGEGVSVRRLPMRTSVSGVIEDTNRQPISGVTVRLIGTGIFAITGAEGSFILPDAQPSPAATLEIDGGTVPTTLPYPTLRLKMRIVAEQDNQLSRPVALQQATGPSIRAGAGALAISSSPAQTVAGRIQNNGVIFEVRDGTSVSFPDSGRIGALTLSIIENNRTPVNLPAGQFSAIIPQITPFGAVLLPGAKLTFPNPDGYPAGTPVKLFRLDQNRANPGDTLGSFVETGTAVVSADGQRIETGPNAITEVSVYFVSNDRPTTTVVGRVVDSDGVTPVRQALVRARGQEAFTDGNGAFTLRGVVVSQGDLISVEASFVRPNGRVDRTQRNNISTVVGGETPVAPALVLPSEISNRQPVVLAPTILAINAGETRDINVVAYDPDMGQTIRIAVTGANFASIIPQGNDVYTLRLNPRADDAGRYTLKLTATDNLNLSAPPLDTALAVNSPPIANAQSVTVNEDEPRTITLTGSDLDGDPLRFSVVNNPLNGQLTGAAPNLTYTPRANYNGTDSFTFKVNDGLADSRAATVLIGINPVNDPPTLSVSGLRMVNSGENLALTVTASDIDANQTLTLSVTNLPGGASFNPATGQFNWTPRADQIGSHEVTFTVTDNGTPPKGDEIKVIITVTPRWEQTQGLLGGQIFDFLSSGQNVFAGGSGGVYLSINQGQTWTLSSRDLANSRVLALRASGANLFAGTDGGGVFRSTNQGLNWVRMNRGLPLNVSVTAFAEIGGSLFAGTDTGVYRSSDQGSNWTAVNDNLANARVNVLVAGGADLFAGTDGGVFRLPGGSQPWAPFNTGLPNQKVFSLAVSGSTLYAGLDNEGVYRSPAQAPNWAAFNSSGLLNLTVLSLAVSGGDLLAGTFGGVFVSALQTPNWTARNQGLTNRTVHAIAPLSGSLLAGTHGGVFRSVDQGQNWAASNAGIRGVVVNSLAVKSGNLFAGTNSDGVYRSINQGQSWEPANANLQSRTTSALAVMGANLFAGTDNGVYLSLDNGAAWRECNDGLPPARYINTLAVSGTTLYAGSGATSGVFVSTNWSNQCRNWTTINTGIIDRDIRSLAVSADCLFAGTETGGVFRTCNQGQSWMQVNAGLTNLSVHALAAHDLGASGRIVFAGTGNGVFLSRDQGQSWTRISEGLPPGAFVNTLLVSGAGNDLFAGLFGGVYVLPLLSLSTGQNQSWSAANTDLTNFNVFSLAMINTRLYAGTIGGGVYRNR